MKFKYRYNGGMIMKNIIGQITGYIIVTLVMASIVWFMMYQYNEKLEMQNEGRNIVGIMQGEQANS